MALLAALARDSKDGAEQRSYPLLPNTMVLQSNLKPGPTEVPFRSAGVSSRRVLQMHPSWWPSFPTSYNFPYELFVIRPS